MKNILLAGASGLVGTYLQQHLLEDKNLKSLTTLVRSPQSGIHPKHEQVLVDFHLLDTLVIKAPQDVAFCALGTTIKKAGSKDAFYQVDFTFVESFALKAKELGVETFVFVSSMGADPNSMFYYNRVKGRIEERLKEIGFRSLYIVRPSLLLGPRKEKRLGEDFGKLVMKIFGFLIPLKYKGIQGEVVAKAMIELSKESKAGVTIVESNILSRLGSF